MQSGNKIALFRIADIGATADLVLRLSCMSYRANSDANTSDRPESPLRRRL
jgi:hypothetical protein